MKDHRSRWAFWRRACLGLSLVTFLWAVVGPARGGGEPIRILTRPVPLDPMDPDMASLGPLQWCGSLELEFENPEYGELSDLAPAARGTRLHFVADNGFWYTAQPRFDAEGRLVGLDNGVVGRLIGPDGRQLEAVIERDAEALARLADGSMLVAFERLHRILRYPPGEPPLAGVPEDFPKPPGMDRVPGNQGLEAMAGLPDGRILALLESPEGNEFPGFLWTESRWQALGLAGSGDYRPTSISVLPGGDLLIAERRYTPATGVSVRVRRIAQADIEPGAKLEAAELATLLPPLLYDNIEGLAVQATMDEGWVRILLVSDDNLAPDQQTLLLCFLYQE